MGYAPSGNGTPATKYKARIAGSRGTWGRLTVLEKTEINRRSAHDCAFACVPGSNLRHNGDITRISPILLFRVNIK